MRNDSKLIWDVFISRNDKLVIKLFIWQTLDKVQQRNGIGMLYTPEIGNYRPVEIEIWNGLLITGMCQSGNASDQLSFHIKNASKMIA